MVNPEPGIEITPSNEQMLAWGFYGIPRGAKRAIGAKAPSQAIGEVRYVIGWMADQMVRMGWRVLINNSEEWRLDLPDGSRAVSDPEEDDSEAETHPANASRRVLSQVSWDDVAVRLVTTNLFVAGELWYLAEAEGGKDIWKCVSMIDTKLKERIREAQLGVRGLWPHPADADSPDAPLFGVLSILEDMQWLSRLERSQSANRVAMRGIIGIADQLQLATGARSGGDSTFFDDFDAALSRQMDDPSDTSPAILRGPAELVKPESGGMAGLSWLIPEFPYDERIDERMNALVQRLAYGLPIPPELLLGMQAQSRATAFQVEEAGYRAHVEPAAWTVAQVPQDALSALLPDEVGTIQIVPDPTAILARRVSTQNAFDAFDRGAIGRAYLREVLGIPDRAAPETNDEIPAGADPAAEDPGSAAADEAVTSAATLAPADPDPAPSTPETSDDTELAERLYRIDEMCLAELVGASEQAVVKARERVGAAVRSSKEMKAQCPADLSNDELALQVGPDALAELGIDIRKIIPGALAATLAWWRKRLARAQVDTNDVLARVGMSYEFSTNSGTDSESELEAILTASVFDPNQLTAANLRTVMTTAGS